MANKYTGEVDLTIGSVSGTLVYDWAALAAIKSEFGTQAIEELLVITAPDVIAKVLAIGFRKKSPDITEEVIMQASPPVVPMVMAINDALTIAYFGPEKGGKMIETQREAEKELEAAKEGLAAARKNPTSKTK